MKMVKEFKFTGKIQPPDDSKNEKNGSIPAEPSNDNVIDITERLKRATSAFGLESEETETNPELVRFIQIIEKLKILVTQIPLAQRTQLMAGYQNSMDYSDKLVKTMLFIATDEDLTARPVFYLALVEEAFRRGLYNAKKPKLEI